MALNHTQILQTIWGGAVGDAIGNPLEFLDSPTKDQVLRAMEDPVLKISDDTQMSLFKYEALQDGDYSEQPYIDWFVTQVRHRPEVLQASPSCLLHFPGLYQRVAPGTTCMSATSSLSMGHEVSNDSKGNGTVMRAATLAVHTALNNKAPASAFLLAKEDALMTHKHPHAWQSSVLLVAILLNQFQGMPLAVAVFDAASTLKDSLDPQVYAIALDCLNEKKYQCLLNRGRAGWVAEECLALAVGAAHHHPGFISTIAAAVSGIGVDSDTVAGVAGQLSCAGGHQIPRGFAARLEAFSAIKHIVDRYHNLT